MTNEKIVKYLEDDGIQYHMSGFVMLRDAIRMAYESGAYFGLTEIYKTIAAESDSTLSRVERSIRYAVTKVYPGMTSKEYIAKAVYKLREETRE